MTHQERAEKYLAKHEDYHLWQASYKKEMTDLLKAEFDLCAAKAIADWEKSKWLGFGKQMDQKPTKI